MITTEKYYPKWVYDIREDVTRQNKAKYDKAIDDWYDKAEELYPNFYNMTAGKLEAIHHVNKVMGYAREDWF